MTDAGFDAAVDAPAPCSVGEARTDHDGCKPYPQIRCSMETDGNGIRWRRFELSGWITAGLRGAAPNGAFAPVAVMYGSEFDSPLITSTCNGMIGGVPKTWIVPYPQGCETKPQIAWLDEPDPDGDEGMVLKLREEIERVNIALVYRDAGNPDVTQVRWADLGIGDGDPIRFLVSGSGSGYACHVVPDGGNGVIQIAPP